MPSYRYLLGILVCLISLLKIGTHIAATPALEIWCGVGGATSGALAHCWGCYTLAFGGSLLVVEVVRAFLLDREPVARSHPATSRY